MAKEKPKIRVLDIATEQVLFECDIESSDRAYQFAAEMEELGLDIRVQAPTLSQTLTNSLGLSQNELLEYQESLEEEIEHHEGSCCFEASDPEKLTH